MILTGSPAGVDRGNAGADGAQRFLIACRAMAGGGAPGQLFLGETGCEAIALEKRSKGERWNLAQGAKLSSCAPAAVGMALSLQPYLW